jgi:hypothetical protein
MIDDDMTEPFHVDFDAHPPEHWDDDRKRAARLRFLIRRIPAIKRELAQLQEELAGLKPAS